MNLSTEPQTPATAAADALQARLLEFLESRTKTSWDSDVDLFAVGGVSSLFAMELVIFVEQAFAVAVGGEDLTLDNFRTVRAMAALVRRLQQAPGA